MAVANTNTETGIRFGVVSFNSLASWVWDEFYASGTNESEAEALREWEAENPEAGETDTQVFCDSLEIEEPAWSLETDGMKLGISWLGGAPLLWVYESPHRAAVSLCSPCIPNAGNLDCKVPLGEGFACYDIPAEWYEQP